MGRRARAALAADPRTAAVDGPAWAVDELADHHQALGRWLGPSERIRRVVPASSATTSVLALTDVAVLVVPASYVVSPLRLWPPLQVTEGRRGLLGRRVAVRDALGTEASFSLAAADVEVLRAFRASAGEDDEPGDGPGGD